MSMLRKSLLAAAAACAVLILSSPARADSVTLTSWANSTGLTATVSGYSLNGDTFTFTITNTSVAPGPTSVITNIGFALSGDRPNTFTLVSSTNPSYFIVHDLDSGLPPAGHFDFVLMNRPPSRPDPIQFGVGNIANGIQPGQSATFVVSGDFSGLTADQIAQAIWARFQNATPTGSDVVTAQTPEPLTTLLFATGLAGVAARVRRRKANA